MEVFAWNLFECRDWESDPGHCDFQSHALPTELSRPGTCMILTDRQIVVKQLPYQIVIPEPPSASPVL